jgi:hypothetical protein
MFHAGQRNSHKNLIVPVCVLYLSIDNAVTLQDEEGGM